MAIVMAADSPPWPHAGSTCPNCGRGRWWGCRFGCPTKQPPDRESGSRLQDDWYREQREMHAKYCEKCGQAWTKHGCPDSDGIFPGGYVPPKSRVDR